MAEAAFIDISRVENGMGLVMRAEAARAGAVDLALCVTFTLPDGSAVAMTPGEATSLCKGLEGLLMVPFDPPDCEADRTASADLCPFCAVPGRASPMCEMARRKAEQQAKAQAMAARAGVTGDIR